jgi:hypothetical protein
MIAAGLRPGDGSSGVVATTPGCCETVASAISYVWIDSLSRSELH